MRVGLIARADDGGLGTMTTEFARHLNPERSLVVDLGAAGKGVTRVERVANFSNNTCVVTSWPHVDMHAVNWLMDGIDVLYTAETWYWPQIPEVARARNIRTVLHSMPELHSNDIIADQVWVPTNWEIERVRDAVLMPVPVPLDRFPVRESESAKTFLHIAASAMRDRNGTDAVLGALPQVHSPCTIAFQGIDGNLTNPTSPAEIVIRPRIGDYWEATADADVLVLPRRYAGLSLPMQEAMARGMPIITTDLAPQNQWPGVLTVPVESPRPTDMKGGVFNVWDMNPGRIADAIDALFNDPGLYRELAEEARWHAKSISWAQMAPVYLNAFAALLA